MGVRWIGVALTLALVGAAAGYAIGRSTLDQPRTRTGAEPVPAVSPSYPVNEYVVEPDPDIAPLATDLPLRTARFRAGGLRMTAAVPKGWERGPVRGGNQWNFEDTENPRYTYALRVGIVTGAVSLGVARNTRIGALEDAEANGNLEHVVIEELADDGFTATYISGDHQRVTMERWLPDDSDLAYATFAVAGRETDRAGMADLLERVAASADF
jgi:hypothetical protein